MSRKTALITGISGQDAAYLSKLLLEEGYNVIGAGRRSSTDNLWRLRHFNIHQDIPVIPFELLEESNIKQVIEKYKPDEVYNLAAQSFVASSFDQPIYTADVDGMGVLRLLEAIRQVNPQIKFYQASSSEMFGKVQEVPQTETTRFYPRSPYGAAKAFAHHLVVNYRESYGMFACNGILFNHESPLRGNEFVTKKISRNLVHHYRTGRSFELGNLDARRDWGHAQDYVRAMYLIMSAPTPDDYVVSTGETHSVREFVETGWKLLDGASNGIIWSGTGQNEIGTVRTSNGLLVKVNPNFYRPAEVDLLIGDSTKIRTQLGWKPEFTFKTLIEDMLWFDLRNHP